VFSLPGGAHRKTSLPPNKELADEHTRAAEKWVRRRKLPLNSELADEQ
jgi:hypothetical protein